MAAIWSGNIRTAAARGVYLDRTPARQQDQARGYRGRAVRVSWRCARPDRTPESAPAGGSRWRKWAVSSPRVAAKSTSLSSEWCPHCRRSGSPAECNVHHKVACRPDGMCRHCGSPTGWHHSALCSARPPPADRQQHQFTPSGCLLHLWILMEHTQRGQWYACSWRYVACGITN